MTECDVQVSGDLQKLSELLEEALTMAREDREEANTNYENMKAALDDLREAGLPMSEEGELEKATNEALKIKINSSKKLEAVIQALMKITIAMENNKTKLVIADKFLDGGGGKKLTEPVDFKALTKT